MAGEQAGLWARLVDALRGREPGRSMEEGEVWVYTPPGVPAGYQQLRVCQELAGYDFARLTWQVCGPCQKGLVRKIRVTDRWQRRGYGSRMMMRALRDCETYTWTTTVQSEFGQGFFAALAAATGIDFSPDARACAHMRAARGGSRGESRREPPQPYDSPGEPRWSHRDGLG
jgi:GNAT superfamily N-acetyltransferase